MDSSEPLTIEMILPTLYRGGMERVVVDLTWGLRDRGHTVGVTCTWLEGAFAEELRRGGVRVTYLPVAGVWSNVWSPRLQRLLARLRPDVVHVHSGSWLRAVRAARAQRVPCIVATVHGLGSPLHRDRALDRLAARWTDRVVAVSPALRGHLLSTLKIDSSVLRVVSNGIDVTRYRPDRPGGTVRRDLGIGRDRFLIGNVARLHPVKNQAFLLDSFQAIRRQCPEAALLMVGTGELEEQIRNRIRERQLRDHAFLLGPLDDTAPLYRELDLFALSSRSEGTSISLLEAMASGVPAVATAVGGTPAVLGDGQYGVLVGPDDRFSLAAAITRLARDPAARQRLSRVGRERVLSAYTREMMVERYERLYREVLAEKRATASMATTARRGRSARSREPRVAEWTGHSSGPVR